MDDLQKLLRILPRSITTLLNAQDSGVTSLEYLTEIIIDLGKTVQLRYNKRKTETDIMVNQAMIDSVICNLSEFGVDNRAGIPGTLHRISKLVNRHEEAVGLTCRVGMPHMGSAVLIEDLLLEGKNILILGPPSSGKTSMLRDAARFLSETKNVLIIDTSNEIAGDGDVPHSAVGDARRLQVPFRKTQAQVMIEGVENHAPEVQICDELSDYNEAEAARTIAQRGVQLLASAHGRKLEDLIKNPPLCKLIGGVKTVTLSDEQAADRGTTKTVQEREMEPTFDVVVEILSFSEVAIHRCVSEAVDVALCGGYVRADERRIKDGKLINIAGKLAYPNTPVRKEEKVSRKRI